MGGCVRDLVRRAVYGEPVEPKDWDIATSAEPKAIIKLFPKTFYENEYGTVGVVTTAFSGAPPKAVATLFSRPNFLRREVRE